MASSIEWLQGGETWNPIRARMKNGHPVKAAVPLNKVGWACVRISPGCEHCYSEKQNMQCGTNKTRAGTGLPYNVPALDLVDLFLDEETLLAPLHWKKPRLIFPCSMTDWMADFVPDEWRDKMLAVMNLTPQHTYLTLTKRADRQLKYFTAPGRLEALARAENFKPEGKSDNLVTLAAAKNNQIVQSRTQIAAPNQWRGVSAENQEYADKRIPELLQTPAAVRWVSAEPLLGRLDLFNVPVHKAPPDSPADYCSSATFGNPRIDWVVAGGESGPKARPMHPDWIRNLQWSCANWKIPFFFKQWGAWMNAESAGYPELSDAAVNNGRSALIALDGTPWNKVSIPHEKRDGAKIMMRVGKKAAGRKLDGVEHSEYPARPNQCNCSGSWHAIGSQGCTMEAVSASA